MTDLNIGDLKRESFLMHLPEYKEEKYLDPEHKLVGVYREYKHENGNLIRVKQKIMDPLDHIKSELLIV